MVKKSVFIIALYFLIACQSASPPSNINSYVNTNKIFVEESPTNQVNTNNQDNSVEFPHNSTPISNLKSNNKNSSKNVNLNRLNTNNSNIKTSSNNINNSTVSNMVISKSELWCFWFERKDKSGVGNEMSLSEKGCNEYLRTWEFDPIAFGCHKISEETLKKAEVACNTGKPYGCAWYEDVKSLLTIVEK